MTTRARRLHPLHLALRNPLIDYQKDSTAPFVPLTLEPWVHPDVKDAYSVCFSIKNNALVTKWTDTLRKEARQDKEHPKLKTVAIRPKNRDRLSYTEVMEPVSSAQSKYPGAEYLEISSQTTAHTVILTNASQTKAVGYCHFLLIWIATSSKKRVPKLELEVDLVEAYVIPSQRGNKLGSLLSCAVRDKITEELWLLSDNCEWEDEKIHKISILFGGDVTNQSGKNFVYGTYESFKNLMSTGELDGGPIVPGKVEWEARVAGS